MEKEWLNQTSFSIKLLTNTGWFVCLSRLIRFYFGKLFLEDILENLF